MIHYVTLAEDYVVKNGNPRGPAAHRRRHRERPRGCSGVAQRDRRRSRRETERFVSSRDVARDPRFYWRRQSTTGARVLDTRP